MMAQPPLDFPSSPTIGQIYNAPNGVAYIWDGTKWDVVGGTGAGGGGVSIGPNPPTDPQPGQLWWRSDPDGNLYVWYNDGNSSQWVPAMASVGRGTVAAPIGPAGGDLNGSYPAPALNSVLSISSLGLAGRGAFYSGPGGASVGVNVSNHDATFVPSAASWQMNLLNGSGNDELSFQRRQPNAAANAYTSLLTVRTDGTIRVTTDPVAALDLVTKQYVDAHSSGGGGGPWTENVAQQRLTPTTPPRAIFNVTDIFFGSGLNALGTSNGQYELTYATTLDIRDATTGGTLMSFTAGDVTLHNDPTLPLGIATKQYVDAQVGGGGGALWTDDVGASMLVPVGMSYGVALPGSGDGLVIRDPTYPLVNRSTGLAADPNLLFVSGAAQGILFRSADMATPFGRISGTGTWRVAGDTLAATERLEVAGGIKLGVALAAQAGTIQYAGGHFQGYNGTAWVNLD